MKDEWCDKFFNELEEKIREKEFYESTGYFIPNTEEAISSKEPEKFFW